MTHPRQLLFALIVAASLWLDPIWAALAPVALFMPSLFGSCPIFADDFNRSNSTNVGSDWSELLGDWSIDTNRLSIGTTTDAIIKCTTAAGSLNNYQIRVSWATGTGKARVFVNFTDADNWHCAEFDSSTKTVRIFECVATVETLLTEVSSSTTADPVVCVDSDNFLIADYGLATAIWQITPTADGVALGTGDTVSTSIAFDNFSLENPGVGICPACPTCDGCTLHQEMQVDLSGTGTGGGCGAPCDIDGTYIVPIYGMTSPVAVSHGGTGSCHWLLAVSDCSGGVTGILVTSRVTSSLPWRVEILSNNDLNVNPYAVYNQGASGNCGTVPDPSGEVLTVLLCSGPTATLTAL